MKFGKPRHYGVPLWLNGVIVGWVCVTIDSKYKYTLARHSVDSSPVFKTEHQAKMALLSVFGD